VVALGLLFFRGLFMRQPPESEKRFSFWPLAVFGLLLSWFSYQLKPLQQPKEHTESGGARRAQSRAIVHEPVLNVVPSTPGREKITCRPDQTPWWKTTFEILAVLAGLVLLYFNIRQTRASENSANAAEGRQ
jgi:hypothetical protein